MSHTMSYTSKRVFQKPSISCVQAKTLPRSFYSTRSESNSISRDKRQQESSRSGDEEKRPPENIRLTKVSVETLPSHSTRSLLEPESHQLLPELNIDIPENDTSSTALPPSVRVKNLETGEYMHIEEANENVEKLLTFNSFNGSKAGQQLSSDPEQVDPKAVEKRKKATGWLGKVFRRDVDPESSIPKFDVRVRVHKRNVQKLTRLHQIQEINDHSGPIWSMKFSLDGQFLAVGGQDSVVRVYSVIGSKENKKHMARLHEEGKLDNFTPYSPRHNSGSAKSRTRHSSRRGSRHGSGSRKNSQIPNYVRDLLNPIPYRQYKGHKSDVIALAWSKANFLLSASMDRTVMLWHVSRQKCLCLFQHNDFVTAVAFHPVEDTLFLSGSFDKKIRLWNILDHRVACWAQTPTMVTSAAFSSNGEHCVAGLFDGQCILYSTDGLKEFTRIDCRNRRGKFSNGRKVTGIQFAPTARKLLVTTNDSRIRLFDMDDFSLVQKYKGLENGQLQIQASFNADGTSIICGSDDQHVYVWDVLNEYIPSVNAKIFKKPDRNDSYEYFKAGSEIVTVALFAPNETRQISQECSDIRDAHLQMQRSEDSEPLDLQIHHLIVTSGYNGDIKVFENYGDPQDC
uniref:WD repeat-containing protein 44 n=1 Tax=Hirondellea gigas TaxID=1518452 RepID=A0A6A7FQZ5_9CRUS